jgi:hypothetical protein
MCALLLHYFFYFSCVRESITGGMSLDCWSVAGKCSEKKCVKTCSGARGGADTFLLYVVLRFVMYTASALESWANLRKET